MANGTDAYLKTQVLTASPEKLQLLLYEGAIRFAGQARDRMVEGSFEASHELLVRAQRVMLELMCGLRPELNPDLCGRLGALYVFIYRKLIDANIRHDPKDIDDAVSVLSIQRDTWLQLLDKLADERAPETSGASISA